MVWTSPMRTGDYEFLITYENSSDINTQLYQYSRWGLVYNYDSSITPLTHTPVTVATAVGSVTSHSINCSSVTISPTRSPSPAPTDPTGYPTPSPTASPTDSPTGAPSDAPTRYPSSAPTYPTAVPTQAPTRLPKIYYNVSFLIQSERFIDKENDPSNSFYVQIKGDTYDWTHWNHINISLILERVHNGTNESIIVNGSDTIYGNYSDSNDNNNNNNNDHNHQSYVYYNDSGYIWYNFDLYTDNVGSPKNMRVLTYQENDLSFACFNVSKVGASVSFCDSESVNGITISYDKADEDDGCYWVEIFLTDDDYETYNSETSCVFDTSANATGTLETTRDSSGSGGGENGSNDTDLTKFHEVVTFVILGILLLAILVLAFGKMYHGSVKIGSDPPSYKSIISYFSCVFDLWTDLAALVVYFYYKEDELIFIFGCVFTFVPYFVSCIVGIYTIEQWRNNKLVNRMRMWLNEYSIVLYLVTITSTFYGAVDLCKSKVFYFECFGLPLRNIDYIQLLQYRFLNLTILENLPQLVIQCYYLNRVVTESVFNHPIVLLSMIFSIISMLLSIVSQVSRVCQRMNPQSEEYYEQLVIESYLVIRSEHLGQHHAFCHKRVESSIYNTLYNIENVKNIMNRSDISFQIECYNIDDKIEIDNEIRAYFQINIFTNDENTSTLIERNIRNMGDNGHKNYRNLKKVELSF